MINKFDIAKDIESMSGFGKFRIARLIRINRDNFGCEFSRLSKTKLKLQVEDNFITTHIQ